MTESPGETPHCRIKSVGSVPYAAVPVRAVTRQPQPAFLMRSHHATLSGSQSDCDRAPRSVRFFPMDGVLLQPSQRRWRLQKCAAPMKTHVFPLASDFCWKQTEEGLKWKIGFPLRKHVVPLRRLLVMLGDLCICLAEIRVIVLYRQLVANSSKCKKVDFPQRGSCAEVHIYSAIVCVAFLRFSSLSSVCGQK